jgi:hypothetical protein
MNSDDTNAYHEFHSALLIHHETVRTTRLLVMTWNLPAKPKAVGDYKMH